MKRISVIVLAVMLLSIVIGVTPVDAQKIDSSTPSHERPIIEEPSFEGLEGKSKKEVKADAELVRLLTAFVAILVLGGVVGAVLFAKNKHKR